VPERILMPCAVPHLAAGYSLECGLERAVEMLGIAMTPEPTSDAYPHLDIDGEPGVTVGRESVVRGDDTE